MWSCVTNNESCHPSSYTHSSTHPSHSCESQYRYSTTPVSTSPSSTHHPRISLSHSVSHSQPYNDVCHSSHSLSIEHIAASIHSSPPVTYPAHSSTPHSPHPCSDTSIDTPPILYAIDAADPYPDCPPTVSTVPQSSVASLQPPHGSARSLSLSPSPPQPQHSPPSRSISPTAVLIGISAHACAQSPAPSSPTPIDEAPPTSWLAGSVAYLSRTRESPSTESPQSPSVSALSPISNYGSCCRTAVQSPSSRSTPGSSGSEYPRSHVSPKLLNTNHHYPLVVQFCIFMDLLKSLVIIY